MQRAQYVDWVPLKPLKPPKCARCSSVPEATHEHRSPRNGHASVVSVWREMPAIPRGENPAEYMALFFDWVQYFKNKDACLKSRMPYTKSFNLEKS